MNARSGRPTSRLVGTERVHVTRGGVDVVRGVDLQASRGEWVGLVGPNGAGKTSLLLALAGLLPYRGRIMIGTLDIARADRRWLARNVALMPQRPVVPPGTTVAELVALGRTPHIGRFGVESAADRAVVDAALERLGLAALARRPATDLSGGELQRVVLARALAQQPQVLLLDEPTSALDVGHQQHVLDLVDELRRDERITVLAAMHDLTLAGQYADRLVLMADGVVRAEGDPADVLDAALLAEVYGARVRVLPLPGGPAVVPLPSARTRAGESPAVEGRPADAPPAGQPPQVDAGPVDLGGSGHPDA